MKFGLFHSVQLPNPSEQERYYREALEQVLHAERLGYNSVWFTEHHFTRHGIVSATMSVLAYLAGLTETIRLGTAVTVLPFHNPVQLAEQLDHLVLGRGLIAKPDIGGVPDLLDGASSIHQTDDIVGGLGEAVIPRRGMVLKHVPQMTAVVVTMYLRVTSQLRAKILDPVPGRAEQ